MNFRKVKTWKGYQRQGSPFSLTERAEKTQLGLSSSVILWKGRGTVRKASGFSCGWVAPGLVCAASGFGFLICQVRRPRFFPSHRVATGQKTFLKSHIAGQKQIVISRFTSLFWLFKARGCQSLRAGQNALPLPLLERLLPFSCQPVSCLEFVPGVASAAIGTTGVASQNT